MSQVGHDLNDSVGLCNLLIGCSGTQILSKVAVVHTQVWGWQQATSLKWHAPSYRDLWASCRRLSARSTPSPCAQRPLMQACWDERQLARSAKNKQYHSA